MTTSEWMSPSLLKGKNAFVTGGSSGINLGIARAFVQHGASVAICARDPHRLNKATDELNALSPDSAVGFAADVRDPEALHEALGSACERHGPVDILICGAAGNFLSSSEKLSPKGFRTVIDIDLNGSFNAASAAFPQLKQTAGSVLFISAGQAFVPFSQQVHAGAAKAGVENLMRNLALEWGPHGIRCNSIVPGPIAGTEGVRRLAQGVGGEDAWAQMVPLQRLGALDEISGMAVVLCSPLASYVTGATVLVDGGFSLPGSGVFNAALDRHAMT